MALRELDPHTEFAKNGFCVVRNLFTNEECDALTAHYMKLREKERPGDFAGVDLTSQDPLKKYPRMIHMHRWDELSLKWMTDPRLARAMTSLLGEEPFAVQTMLYFKPAGARGQALHQDQYYLRAQPGTCIAAWLALDACDVENGCMQVVPGSSELPVLCTIDADTTQSFTDVTVPLPKGTKPVPVPMEQGDVLFFNGSVIHGSFPNTSKSRFRRALIGHYVTGNARQVSTFYHPALRMDGTPVELEPSQGGGKCGEWSEEEGSITVQMHDEKPHESAHE